MFEKFTERLRKVMSLARIEAQNMNSEFIGTEHLLIGILRESGGVAAKILKNMNVDIDVESVRLEVRKLVQSSRSLTLGQIPFSPLAKHVIELSEKASLRLGHDVIGTEHLLIGLMEEKEGIAFEILNELGVKPAEVEKTIREVFGIPDESKPCSRCHGTGLEPA